MEPLTEELKHNMAYRYRHDFGLKLAAEQSIILSKMEELYSLYSKDLSDEEISRASGFGRVVVSQVREEVEGRGFYKKRRMV